MKPMKIKPKKDMSLYIIDDQVNDIVESFIQMQNGQNMESIYSKLNANNVVILMNNINEYYRNMILDMQLGKTTHLDYLKNMRETFGPNVDKILEKFEIQVFGERKSF